MLGGKVPKLRVAGGQCVCQLSFAWEDGICKVVHGAKQVEQQLFFFSLYLLRELSARRY